jgi:hypothetical protein
MSNDIFLYVFLTLAVVDIYFSMVQRTSVLICRIGEMSMSIGGFLNPSFIKFGFPLTLIKWSWVAYWAWTGSTSQALIALFISWLAAVALPVPGNLTLPPIFKQIERVRGLDPDLGAALKEAAKTWEVHGSRR